MLEELTEAHLVLKVLIMYTDTHTYTTLNCLLLSRIQWKAAAHQCSHWHQSLSSKYPRQQLDDDFPLHQLFWLILCFDMTAFWWHDEICSRSTSCSSYPSPARLALRIFHMWTLTTFPVVMVPAVVRAVCGEIGLLISAGMWRSTQRRPARPNQLCLHRNPSQ